MFILSMFFVYFVNFVFPTFVSNEAATQAIRAHYPTYTQYFNSILNVLPVAFHNQQIINDSHLAVYCNNLPDPPKPIEKPLLQVIPDRRIPYKKMQKHTFPHPDAGDSWRIHGTNQCKQGPSSTKTAPKKTRIAPRQ